MNQWGVMQNSRGVHLLERDDRLAVSTRHPVEWFDDEDSAVARIKEIDPEWGQEDPDIIDEDDDADHTPKPSRPMRITKLTIWQRATDEEAEKMVAMLEQQPTRLRKMWEDSQFLSTDHPLFGQIEAALTELLGAERASELLSFSKST